MTKPIPTTFLLDPSLGIDGQALAAAWNANPRRRAAAKARVGASRHKSFDPALAELATLVLIPMLVNLSTSALYDMIKLLLIEQGVMKTTRVVAYTAPDGTRVQIITVEEKPA